MIFYCKATGHIHALVSCTIELENNSEWAMPLYCVVCVDEFTRLLGFQKEVLYVHFLKMYVFYFGLQVTHVLFCSISVVSFFRFLRYRAFFQGDSICKDDD